jgi:hypothetical protein
VAPTDDKHRADSPDLLDAVITGRLGSTARGVGAVVRNVDRVLVPPRQRKL